jgi:hypothetical protein
MAGVCPAITEWLFLPIEVDDEAYFNFCDLVTVLSYLLSLVVVIVLVRSVLTAKNAPSVLASPTAPTPTLAIPLQKSASAAEMKAVAEKTASMLAALADPKAYNRCDGALVGMMSPVVIQTHMSLVAILPNIVFKFSEHLRKSRLDTSVHVQHIDTHVTHQHNLQTPRLLYQTLCKTEKSIRLPFVDFSTLARRHYFCFEEVRLNQRLCPDIYLGVRAVRNFAGDDGDVVCVSVGGVNLQPPSTSSSQQSDLLAMHTDVVDASIVDYAVASRFSAVHKLCTCKYTCDSPVSALHLHTITSIQFASIIAIQ